MINLERREREFSDVCQYQHCQEFWLLTIQLSEGFRFQKVGKGGWL